jgi:hypothetical protein
MDSPSRGNKPERAICRAGRTVANEHRREVREEHRRRLQERSRQVQDARLSGLERRWSSGQVNQAVRLQQGQANFQRCWEIIGELESQISPPPQREPEVVYVSEEQGHGD